MNLRNLNTAGRGALPKLRSFGVPLPSIPASCEQSSMDLPSGSTKWTYQGVETMYDPDEDLEWLDVLEDLDGFSLTEVVVDKLPQCDTCFAYKRLVGIPAAYDGKTKKGPWACMCQECFEKYGVGLGLGKGQRLVLKGTNNG